MSKNLTELAQELEIETARVNALNEELASRKLKAQSIAIILEIEKNDRVIQGLQGKDFQEKIPSSAATDKQAQHLAAIQAGFKLKKVDAPQKPVEKSAQEGIGGLIKGLAGAGAKPSASASTTSVQHELNDKQKERDALIKEIKALDVQERNDVLMALRAQQAAQKELIEQLQAQKETSKKTSSNSSDPSLSVSPIAEVSTEISEAPPLIPDAPAFDPALLTPEQPVAKKPATILPKPATGNIVQPPTPNASDIGVKLASDLAARRQKIEEDDDSDDEPDEEFDDEFSVATPSQPEKTKPTTAVLLANISLEASPDEVQTRLNAINQAIQQLRETANKILSTPKKEPPVVASVASSDPVEVEAVVPTVEAVVPTTEGIPVAPPLDLSTVFGGSATPTPSIKAEPHSSSVSLSGGPAPVTPAPVTPAPVAPTPIAPTPVAPTPASVTPAPIAPTLVAPTPVAPTSVAPTPASAAPVDKVGPTGVVNSPSQTAKAAPQPLSPEKGQLLEIIYALEKANTSYLNNRQPKSDKTRAGIFTAHKDSLLIHARKRTQFLENIKSKLENPDANVSAIHAELLQRITEDIAQDRKDHGIFSRKGRVQEMLKAAKEALTTLSASTPAPAQPKP